MIRNPKHFRWEQRGQVGVVTLDRPDRKNPLTFESYDELRNTFYDLASDRETKSVVITGSGGNFCSGGDVHEIIGPLTKKSMPELLEFTRMTGDLIRAIRACPQPVVGAIDGVCVGAGAAIAMACDLRYGTPRAKTAFLFVRVGLAGCDMGACAIVPRIIGQGRASELFYSGRVMTAEEGERWGWFNRVCAPEVVFDDALKFASELAYGPTFAHSMTKNQLNLEWNMSLDAAIEAEAQAQAICMQTADFRRAYEGFVAKQPAKFEGN